MQGGLNQQNFMTYFFNYDCDYWLDAANRHVSILDSVLLVLNFASYIHAKIC